MEQLAEEVQRTTGDHVELGYVDQGYTGEAAESAAARHAIQLEVVKHTEAKRGFVLLPRRWVVERSIGWAARFRRLARDYERLAQTPLPSTTSPSPHAQQNLQTPQPKLLTGLCEFDRVFDPFYNPCGCESQSE